LNCRAEKNYQTAKKQFSLTAIPLNSQFYSGKCELETDISFSTILGPL
jgi:hypothetical protein